MRLPFSTKQGLSSSMIPTGRFGTPSFTVENVEELKKIFITEFTSESQGSESCSGQTSENYAVLGGTLSAQGVTEEDSFWQAVEVRDLDNIFQHYAQRDRSVKLSVYIGRQHRRNGVMCVVNCRSRTGHFKCHDRECEGFLEQLLVDSDS
ncbi:hypothetical protein CBR_g47979 [Chara braunii]|uniref:Uncharacterized protein n=1 Tax=Chara braunii TaxID=69332 RepID=A0A388M1P9_CHABU|nr:hypothetical protein CBR_g47979 [Chara braunii]|eukprot:GBG88508.1 hypothetical protein CBR_g47979 [Chara braunii]